LRSALDALTEPLRHLRAPGRFAMQRIRLIPSYPERIWLDIFGARLMQLRPDMSAKAASQHAMEAFADVAGLEPDEAAEVFEDSFRQDHSV
jgi:hypothetical protein